MLPLAWTQKVGLWTIFFGAARAVERFWRTLKYEHVYLRGYADGLSLWKGLDKYFHRTGGPVLQLRA